MQYWARISVEQPQDDANSGNKWLCKAEMETRFGFRLTCAMLYNGNMKNMLCFATHSMAKDMCMYKRPNIVDETLGSTDTVMILTSGTDCDNPLATEATCSPRWRAEVAQDSAKYALYLAPRARFPDVKLLQFVFCISVDAQSI